MRNFQLYGNRKNLFMSVWVLLACVFIAINGYGFMTMLEDPLPYPSQEVKSVKMKYRNLEDLSNSVTEVIDFKTWDIIKQKFTKKSKVSTKDYASNNMIQKADKIITTQDLPMLSGILTISTDDHRTIHLAVLNGKARMEQEEMNGFIIVKITEKDVTLTQKGRHFVIYAPEVKYSLSHGR